MKKTLAMLLAAACVCSLAACGAKEAAPAAAAPAATTAAAAAPAAAPAAQAAPAETKADLGNFEMIIGHAQPEGNPRFVSLEKFAKDVAEKTDGHVKVTVYGNGQLGTEKEMLEQVVQGTIQGMRGGQFDFSPRLLMFSAPFLTNTRPEVTALLQSDLAKKVCLEAEGETGTVIINLCDAGGYRELSNNKHVITKPDDLKGLKMRTNGMKTMDLTLQALGATTVSVPYGELYMALKTGVADGQENPFVNVEGMKFYEVQKYFTEINYQIHPDPFYVNAAWWNSLPAEYQSILAECATEMGEYNDSLIDQNSDKAKQTIINGGAEIYVPTAEELQAFKEAVQPVYQAMIDAGICTAEEMKEMEDVIAKVK